MIIKIALILLAVVGIFLFFLNRYKEINLPVTILSIFVIIVSAVIGLNTKAIPIFFIIHNLTIAIAVMALVYYFLTQKFFWFLIYLPLISLGIYLVLAYTIGSRESYLTH